MKITQKLLDELCYLVNNSGQYEQNTDKLKGKKAVIFRTAKGLRDAIYSEALKDDNLVEPLYYGKIEELANDFLNDYWKEWKKDNIVYCGLKSKEANFNNWIDYDGKLHEFVDGNFYSFDADEILDNSNEVETDTGLLGSDGDWQKMKDGIAFWTLKNDLGFAIIDKAKSRAEKENISIEKIE